jgi:hypothetical protein
MSAQYFTRFFSPLNPECLLTPALSSFGGGEGEGGRGFGEVCGDEDLLGVNCVYARPHPGPMTRSLPLTRPSRTSAFGQTLFAAFQAAQVPWGEGETLARLWRILGLLTQCSVGKSARGLAHSRTLARVMEPTIA